MTDKDLDHLVAHIAGLMDNFLEEREKTATPGKVIRAEDVDIRRILSEGLFPPDDPTTASRLALLSIGETLGRVGGEPLMHQVHQAYEGKHGAHKANSLSARWDTAAGLWYY